MFSARVACVTVDIANERALDIALLSKNDYFCPVNSPFQRRLEDFLLSLESDDSRERLSYNAQVSFGL